MIVASLLLSSGEEWLCKGSKNQRTEILDLSHYLLHV